MPTQFVTLTGHGHPWDKRPGFDLLEFRCDSMTEVENFVAAAEDNFWKPWMVGTTEKGKLGGVLYRPSGAKAAWEDSTDNPHPGLALREGNANQLIA